MFALSDIERVHDKISDSIIETPLMYMASLSKLLDAHVCLKLENRQIGGSIKSRAAFTRVSLSSESEKLIGYSTASSGNHGISMSIACAKYGVPLNLFLPENTPGYKVEKLKKFGANLSFHGHSWDDADQHAQAYSKESGATYVHAFEDDAILMGHATCAFEVTKQFPSVDLTVCSIGGGGIISAFSDVIKKHNPNALCYGVETLGAHSVSLSLERGCPTILEEITSLAQSICVQSPTKKTYQRINMTVEGVAVVSDYEAQEHQRNIYRETGELIELASSCSVAALAGRHIPDLKGRNIVILACGGNTDVSSLSMEIGQQSVDRRFVRTELQLAPRPTLA